jgi:acyl carrier protein
MSTSSAKVIERIREYVVENYLYMRQDVHLLDDDPLLARGIIDSMGVMELIVFLEEEFGVTVGDADITEANLGSLAAMARYVVSKQTSVSAASPAA